MEGFKNAIVDSAIEHCNDNCVPLDQLNLLVSRGLLKSHLATSFLEKIAYQVADCSANSYAHGKQLESLTHILGNAEALTEFLTTLERAIYLKGSNDQSILPGERPCCFHSHRETPRCYATKPRNMIKDVKEADIWDSGF
jgi:hypothetical protein